MTYTEKYNYIIKHALRVKAVYALGIISWILCLVGFYQFFKTEPVLALIFGPIVLTLTLDYFTTYGINLFYRRFNVEKHNQKVADYFAHTKDLPSVDVFLPIAGEAIEIIGKTWDAVAKISYPDKGKVNVFVLDDKGHPEYAQLAEQYGFTYLSRENKGHMKKAGNIKHGFDQTKGDFILILDADFIPDKEIIMQLLPYFVDSKIAIVQSPQYFDVTKDVHDRSAIEYGAGYAQEDFYKIIQPARERFNGIICVGSNALYRRSALEEIGGTFQIDHSEDIWTGYSLISKGYKLKYIPIILAKGLCPDDPINFFKQQYRWCMGTLSLVRSRLFWTRKTGLITKLCYLSGWFQYINTVLGLLFTFQILTVFWFFHDSIRLENTIVFWPTIIFLFFVVPVTRQRRMRYGSIFAHTLATWSYGYAIIADIFRQKLEWKVSNVRSRIPRQFYTMLGASVIYLIIYVSFLAALAIQGKMPLDNLAAYLSYFWIIYALITMLVFVGHLSKIVISEPKKHIE